MFFKMKMVFLGTFFCCISASNWLSADDAKIDLTSQPVSSGCSLEGMVGTFPVKIRYAINQLAEVDSALKSGVSLPQVFKNRLLLYGPPGNGKTTIARKIAAKAGAHFIYKNTPELISKYQGQSAASVKAIFEEASDHADREFQVVVIAFDEIDTLASNVESEQRAEYLAALQELWSQLDCCTKVISSYCRPK